MIAQLAKRSFFFFAASQPRPAKKGPVDFDRFPRLLTPCHTPRWKGGSFSNKTAEKASIVRST